MQVKPLLGALAFWLCTLAVAAEPDEVSAEFLAYLAQFSTAQGEYIDPIDVAAMADLGTASTEEHDNE